MRPDRVAGYMDDLARALRARGAYTRDLVDEVRDHLIDSVEAGKRRGLSSDAAEDEALTIIGTPEAVAQHAAVNVPRFRRSVLLILCLCTMCSVAYLSLSLLILRPPRASRAWPAEAVFVLLVTALTFAWAKSGGLSPWIRPVLVFGTLTLGALGGVSIYAAVTGNFEGYSVVLGTLFTIQALLTLLYLNPRARGFLRRS
ncbi:MAG: permease prefix domain 1-containing protein [Gemmatimonadaceae bacterium]